MKKVLMIGGGGFLAVNIIQDLNFTQYFEPYLISTKRLDTNLPNFSIQEMLTDSNEMQFDYIINMALRRNPANALESREFNANLPLKIIEKFATNTTKVINISTYLQFFDFPKDAKLFNYQQDKRYLASRLKALSEMNCFEYTDLVIYTMYGPNDKDSGFTSKLLASLRNGIPLKTSQGDQLMSFTHVEDVVRGIIRVLNSGELSKNKSWSIWPTPLLTMRQYVDQLELPDNSISWGSMPYAGHELFESKDVFPEQLPDHYFLDFKQSFFNLL
jgi:nucleoside-diphosphate-sugar epimerase